eukprot:TRINITY_DN11289_c0_g1_i1.p4 TRINITY_DN11289_c0_g1~~TRINITY_DN11289_c0_g1_i1.p4  ORF type:complete len:66 (+),score=9.11 TRINITY_DN11289_c0_g1_i1:209-406(+)
MVPSDSLRQRQTVFLLCLVSKLLRKISDTRLKNFRFFRNRTPYQFKFILNVPQWIQCSVVTFQKI